MLRTISQLHPRSTSLLRSLPRTIYTYLTATSSPASITNPNNLTLNPHNSPQFPQFSTLSSPFSSTRFLERRGNDNNCNDNDSVTEPPKLFVVQPRHRSESVLQTKLQEALNLANSLEEQRDGYYDTEFSEKKMPAHVVVQNPMSRSPRADTYFGHGTVDTVKIHINALESKSKDTVDAIFVNATLTSIQQRNLERKWGKPVLDRVGLIIEIFNAHAQTKEAKLQAELAALMYKRSRLVRVLGPDGRSTFGTGGMEVVSARGRGGGGQGFMSGAGETELQLQRRRILDRRTQLLSEIKEVRRTRALQRASRRRHDSNGQGIPTVAVVGYTNAGKSTLVSSLSDTYLFCDDRLFATVDPKLRSVILPSGSKVLLSDTVGFISDLPVQLVEAFHATLEEVVEADLLVHVLDSSSPNLDEQREAVLLVLEQIGVSKEKLKNMIEVWNKIDLEDQEFDLDEYDDEEVDCLSGGEDEDDGNASDELRCSDSEACELDDSNNDNEKSGVSANLDDVPDDWLKVGGELESWVNYEDSSLGQEIPEGTTRQEPTSMTWKYTGKDSRSESGFTPHVKTSAVTGTGLHELLELIDERLKNQSGSVVERNMIDRKWRPPRSEADSTVAAAI